MKTHVDVMFGLRSSLLLLLFSAEATFKYIPPRMLGSKIQFSKRISDKSLSFFHYHFLKNCEHYSKVFIMMNIEMKGKELFFKNIFLRMKIEL